MDLGAGTGKLTTALEERSEELLAIEAEFAMIRRLAERPGSALLLCARAESLPIASGWADCVVVAQAFHWFDNEMALSEIARILRERGRLALIWNVRDRSVDWVDELVSISGPDNAEAVISNLTSRPFFEPFEAKSFRTVQIVDRDALVAHVRSRSHVATLDEDERLRVVEAVRDLGESHPSLAGKTRFEFPYVTRAFRARRAES